jgi:HlyD family secretion protein
MKVRPVKLIVILLVVAGIAALVYYSATRPVEVETAEIVRGPIRSSVEEDGETRVVDRYVVSAPVSGRLLRVEVEEDQRVEADEVVARIDSTPLDAQVEEAEARIAALKRQIEGADRKRPKPEEIERAEVQEESAAAAREVAARELEEAKAAAEQARREVVRAEDLYEERTISSSQKEEAELAHTRAVAALRAKERLVRIRELEHEAAVLSTKILKESVHDVDWEEEYYRAQIEAVSAELKAVRDDRERTEVKAPASGKVLRRHIESETVVAAGTPILEIGDTTRLEVEVDFLSEDAAHMREGMPVEISGRALGDEVVEGEISKIYPSAFEKVSSLGVEQQRVTVIAGFDAKGTGLGDRFSVDVRVILEEKDDVVLVPVSALSRTPDGDWQAFRLANGRVELVTVKTGLRDGFRCEVLEGLGEGDEVVVYPEPDLENGDRAVKRTDG